MRLRKLSPMLLARLAAQNLSRRRLRVTLLVLSVSLAVGVGLACVVLGWSIRGGISANFSRMGADMIIVPRNTRVNITSSLLTVQPTEEVMPGSIEKELERIPGVARVAPQRMVSVSVEGQRFKVIAFDPETDFTVLNWLGRPATKAFAAGDLLAGSSVSGQPGETLSVCSEPLRIYGRLGKTGVGPFDEAYFVTFETLGRLAGKDLHPATESSLSRASMKDP